MQRLLCAFLVLAMVTLTAGQARASSCPTCPEVDGDINQAAGVPSVMFHTAQWASKAVELRTSSFFGTAGTKLTAMHRNADGTWSDGTGLSAGDGSRVGLGVWFMPFYSTNNVWGMDAGNGNRTGYISGAGGGSLGVDYLFQNILVGLSFTGGRGFSLSRGDLPQTFAEMGFWGITAYSAVFFDNFNLGLDLGYTGGHANSKMTNFNVESDSQSSTFTAGIRGSYVFRTDFMDITPHVSVRFTGSTTYRYTVQANGIGVTNVDDSYQSNWTFPVGVKFSKNVQTESGWTWSPSLDLYITPTAGDLYSRGRSSPVGNPANVTESRAQILDVMTYSASAGIGVSNGGFSAGLNYTFDAAAHRAAHNIGISLRYDF